MEKKKRRGVILLVIFVAVAVLAVYQFRGRFVSTNDSVSYDTATQKVLIAYFSHANAVGVGAVSSASLVSSNGE
jgi:hypothetical protein